MKRREFMVAASGVTGGAVVATAGTPVLAEEDDTEEENGDDEGEDEEPAGATETVLVGAGGSDVYEPEELVIEPGTTVQFVWEGPNHNVNPTDQPEDADWEGYLDVVDDPHEFESTFEVEGTYEYQCDPHVGVGMFGTIEVTTDMDEAAAGGEVDIDDVGVPIQKHFVGVATFLAIFVSLVFTFYLLKYGESAHTSSPGRK